MMISNTSPAQVNDMEIFPNIQIIKGIASRQYLIRDIDEFTLIDAGLRMDAKKIIKFLDKHIHPPRQLNQILITHADGDHFGAVNSILQKYPGTKIRASGIECEAIQKGVSSREIKAKGCLGIIFKLGSSLFRSDPTSCVGDLEPDLELPILGGLRVLDTSGHTPGHRSFFLIEHKVLFAGDSILVHGENLVPSSGANTWDLGKAKKAFEDQLELDPDIIAGGHGWLKRK